MEKENGSITLEATIFLTMFLLAYLAFMDLVQVGRTQMILQYTLDETVKELAQSTYILTKAGVVEKSVQTGQKAAAFEAKTVEMVNSVKDLANVLEGGNGNLQQQVDITSQNISNYFGNSEELLEGIATIAKSEIGNAAKTFLIEQICQGCLERQLKNMSDIEPNAYLAKLGIKGGMGDIEFGGTSWFENSREIDVVMTYKMTYNLGVLGIQERTFKVRAKTAIW